MLALDLPFLDLAASPKEAFDAMSKSSRSAVVTGTVEEYRLIRVEDVVRAVHSRRHTIAELPYQPAGGSKPLFTGQLDFTIQNIVNGIAIGMSASERKGWPVQTGPVDCYCLTCSTATAGAADGDTCRVCSGSIHCVRH